MPFSPLSLHFPRVSSVFRTKNNFCFPTSLYFPAPFPFFFLFLILAFTEAAVPPSSSSSSCNSSLIYFLREKFLRFLPIYFPFLSLTFHPFFRFILDLRWIFLVFVLLRISDSPLVLFLYLVILIDWLQTSIVVSLI